MVVPLAAGPVRIYDVRNPLHDTRYRVIVAGDDFAVCGCPDFDRRALGTCKHIEAARRLARLRPTAPVTRPERIDPPSDAAALWERAEAMAERPWAAAPNGPGLLRALRERASFLTTP